ncbi:8432_t:CDS:2 [Paraglomus occultum]|uniref:8432_t:CDS:1 n=1 Tax=Paraglomus occultum TaxID=144539 RepID=A0A9N9F7E5_9GLOM|nr:8432_t:CDS:2 [Paraglomus occultum]
MSFSGVVVLTDLDDYIAPSQACIMPVEVRKNENEGAKTSIVVDDSGGYYEVSESGAEVKLERASITLNDCLACSGCITSAESILLTMQSQEELYKVLKANKDATEAGNLQDVKTVVVSIAPQSRASLAAKCGLTPLQEHQSSTLLPPSLPSINNASNPSRRRNAMGKGAGAAENTAMTKARLPMLASACPGWICYAEKTHGFVLPYISEIKSPQQIMGVLVKDYLAETLGLRSSQIYHVSVMMCYDKKLEASRSDFFSTENQTRDVDCVLTTGEIAQMLFEKSFSLADSPEAPLDRFTKMTSEEKIMGSYGSASGGYLEYVMRRAAKELFGVDVDVEKEQGVAVIIGRNKDFKEVALEINSKPVLRFAQANGFRNIQNLVRKIKSGSSPYHYVEVMACPSGCINGGGQLKPDEGEMPLKEWINRVNSVYKSVDCSYPEENESAMRLYDEWLGGRDSPKARLMLRTQYHNVETTLVNPLAVRW